MTRVISLGSMLIAVALSGLPSTAAVAREPYPKVNLTAGYELDPDWPRKPADYKWRYVVSTFVDKNDHVWTLNALNPPVQVYTTDGELVDAWGEGEFQLPHDIHIDREGNVWIADIHLHVVKKFTAKGKLLLTLGTPGEPGDGKTHLNGPSGTATTPTGDVFVSDGYGNDRIVHFNSQGRFIKQWGGLGQGDDQLSQPHAIAIDSAGKLYVAERNNCRIHVFDQNGRSLGQWRNLINPWGIWITPADEILVCGSSPVRWRDLGNLGNPPHDQLVIKFNTDGRALELWTFPLTKDGKTTPGHIDWVHGISADSKGNLYLGDVADDSERHLVQKFVRRPAER